MLKIDYAACKKDYICVRECPTYVIGVDEKTGYPCARDTMRQYCIGCGHCVVLCPAGALSHVCHPREKHAAVDVGLMPGPEQVEVLLKTRRSARQFRKQPVPHEVILKLLEVCSYAPSASNKQEIRWIVVENPETTKKLFGLYTDWLQELLGTDPQNEYARKQLGRIRAYGADPVFRTAGQMAIAVMPRSNEWPADAAIALTYFEVYAHSMGLAVCWGGLFVQAVRACKPIRDFLGISDREKVTGVQLFGYPVLGTCANLPPRKPLELQVL